MNARLCIFVFSLPVVGCLPVAVPEDCTVAGDEDLDALADCDDVDCAADPACAVLPEDCSALGDEDGDGAADCDDSDCAGAAACAAPPEDCGASGDEDGDGAADCDDSDCAGEPACATPPEDCGTAGDEDGDGVADCDDSDCSADPACASPPEDCGTPGDEDGDGAEDCGDSDCAGDPLCAPPTEDCSNGVDDDGDSLIDCLDGDCAPLPGCGAPAIAPWTRTLSGVSTSFGESYRVLPGADGLYLLGVPNTVLYAPTLPGEAPGALQGFAASVAFAALDGVAEGSTFAAGGVYDGEAAVASWSAAGVTSAPASFDSLLLSLGTDLATASDVRGLARSSSGALFAVGTAAVATAPGYGFIANLGPGSTAPAFFGEGYTVLRDVVPHGAGVVAVGSTAIGDAGGSDGLIVWTLADGTVQMAHHVGGGNLDNLSAVATWGSATAAAGNVAGANAVVRWSAPGTLEWTRSINRADGSFVPHSLFEQGGDLVVVGAVFDFQQNDPSTGVVVFDSSGVLISAHEYGDLGQETSSAAVPWAGGVVMATRGFGDVWFAGTDALGTLGLCSGDLGDQGTLYGASSLTATSEVYSAFTLGTASLSPVTATWSAATTAWTADCP